MASSAWLHVTSTMRFTEDLVGFLKEQRPEYLPDVLANFRQHGVFPTQDAGDVAGLVGFSNAKLGSNKTRYEGLCLLSLLVKDSSSDLFQQHCIFWLRSLQQIIQSQAAAQTVWLTVNILKDVLHYSCHLPELAREVGLNSILGMLTSLLALKTECELAAMEGMMACMVYYPRACASLKDKLGAYFLSKMDSTNRKAQEMACRCYGHLPCLGGLLGSVIGLGKGEGWINQIHCLLASANSLLAQLYEGAETDKAVHYQGPGVELAFPQLDQTDSHLFLQLQNRYTAVCQAVRHTLRVDPGLAVHLPVRLVLNLVCRALAVTAKHINLSRDGSLRLLVLPSIHTSTLEVLSDLITIVRSGMVQYATVIQRLFSQTLSAWTPQSETNMGHQRAYSLVRVSVYKTLELWVQVVGASASILQGTPGHAELLFSHLVGDITPGADSIKLRAGLSVDVVPGGKPGPRRTKQLVLAEVVGPSLLRKGELLSNQDTCISALRALRQIMQTCGTVLKEDVHKRLHEAVLPLCVRLQQQQSSNSAFESTGGISGQFSSALTRRELYRLLLALVLNPSPHWPPPLTCAVSIFSNGRIDRNLKVASFCGEAQTICNSMLHPRTPSIGLPLPPLTLKPVTTPSVLSSQGSAPRLTLPTLLGGPASGPPFPIRHSLNLGPTSLLGSLENHLSLVPGLPGQAPTPGDLMLSTHTHHQQDPAGMGPPEVQRPVFVRYDKEEADDIEISLGSDSDDSVVIVPPGMLDIENKQDDTVNSQNMISAAPSGSGVTLPDSVATVSTTAAATTNIDVASFPDDFTPSTNPSNSFPSSSASVVSLVPSLNSTSVSAPLVGLGDSLPVKPQLQQMLMQPTTTDQTSPLTLPLQVHQLQNQLSQQGRNLQQHPPAPASNEDSAIININSTDDEEEDEEDMEEDEELEEEEEEEEEEEGIDEDDDEEGSDEFYVGDEYDDFEEGEELEEEEEEEDGDMPPLEGTEEKSGDVAIQEQNVIPAADEEGMTGCSVDGDTGGGIEELQTSRTLFEKDTMKVQKVESIGVLEEEQEGEGEEGENESMDDPTMPQILCVTGGALDERMEASDEGTGAVRDLQQDMSLWEHGAKELELELASEEHTTSQSQQESVTEAAQEDGHQEQHSAVAPDHEISVGRDTEESEQTNANENDINKAEQAEIEEEKEEGRREEGESDGEERKGIKRKREHVETKQEAEQNAEMTKMADETMVSMLADFVACPPDEEDRQQLDCSNICPKE